MIDRDYSLYYDPMRENVTMHAWLRGLLSDFEAGRDNATQSPSPDEMDPRS